jgi:hypothetical protein
MKEDRKKTGFQIKLTMYAGLQLSLLVPVMLFWSDCTSSDHRIFCDLRATLSKSHPWDSASVAKCIAAKDSECLNEARRTIAAVNRLLSKGRTVGLEKTLDAIRCNCQTNRNLQRQKDECHGALVSLYLFDTGSDDSMIFHFLGSLPKETVSNIFLHFETCWIRNRRNPDKWLAFIRAFENISDSAKTRAENLLSEKNLASNVSPLCIAINSNIRKMVASVPVEAQLK